jgi:CRP/FNR family transcriptional regulator, cyclic AMP receptor protein
MVSMPRTMTVASTTAAKPSALGLRAIKLLVGVPDACLEDLAQECRWRRVLAGQRVISRDAQDHDVYLIVGGKVRITAFSGAGRQVTYRDIATGDWFGDLAAIDGGSRSADVDALEDTLLAAVTPVLFRRLLHEHPVVCDRVLDRLAGLVRDLTERVFDFSTLGVQNRVHAELLRLAKEAGVQGNSARIEPAPKHSDIAGKVSSYREQGTCELSAMAKQGLIERSNGALLIPDVARLERIVSEVRRLA